MQRNVNHGFTFSKNSLPDQAKDSLCRRGLENVCGKRPSTRGAVNGWTRFLDLKLNRVAKRVLYENGSLNEKCAKKNQKKNYGLVGSNGQVPTFTKVASGGKRPIIDPSLQLK